MKKNSKNLIWIDLEMTGLDTFNDRVIEIATIVTDKDLHILEEGPVIAIKTPQEAIDKMDDWNTHQHNKSGLVERILKSSYTYIDAQEITIEFLQKYIEHNMYKISNQMYINFNSIKYRNYKIIRYKSCGHYMFRRAKLIAPGKLRRKK